MAAEDIPEGYEAPLHRSLTKPLYWGGVPRNILLLEVVVGVLGGIILKTFVIPVLAVGVHFIFKYLGTQDPYFLDVFWRGKDYENYYEP